MTYPIVNSIIVIQKVWLSYLALPTLERGTTAHNHCTTAQIHQVYVFLLRDNVQAWTKGVRCNISMEVKTDKRIFTLFDPLALG